MIRMHLLEYIGCIYFGFSAVAVESFKLDLYSTKSPQEAEPLAMPWPPPVLPAALRERPRAAADEGRPTHSQKENGSRL